MLSRYNSNAKIENILLTMIIQNPICVYHSNILFSSFIYLCFILHSKTKKKTNWVVNNFTALNCNKIIYLLTHYE